MNLARWLSGWDILWDWNFLWKSWPNYRCNSEDIHFLRDRSAARFTSSPRRFVLSKFLEWRFNEQRPSSKDNWRATAEYYRAIERRLSRRIFDFDCCSCW